MLSLPSVRAAVAPSAPLPRASSVAAGLSRMSVFIPSTVDIAVPALPSLTCSLVSAAAGAASAARSFFAGSRHRTYWHPCFAGAAGASATPAFLCAPVDPAGAVLASSHHPRLTAASSTVCLVLPPASGVAASAPNSHPFLSGCATADRLAVAGPFLSSASSSSSSLSFPSAAAAGFAAATAESAAAASAGGAARSVTGGLRLSAPLWAGFAALLGKTIWTTTAASRRVAATQSATAAVSSQAAASGLQPAAAAGTRHGVHAGLQICCSASSRRKFMTCSGSSGDTRSGYDTSSSSCDPSTQHCTWRRVENLHHTSSSRYDLCNSNSRRRGRFPCSGSSSRNCCMSNSSSSRRCSLLDGGSRGCGVRCCSKKRSTSCRHIHRRASSRIPRRCLASIIKRHTDGSSYDSGDCYVYKSSCDSESFTGPRRDCRIVHSIRCTNACGPRLLRRNLCSSAVKCRNSSSGSFLNKKSSIRVLSAKRCNFDSSRSSPVFAAASSGTSASSNRTCGLSSGCDSIGANLNRSVGRCMGSYACSFSSSSSSSSTSRFFDESSSLSKQEQQRLPQRVRLPAAGLLRSPDLQVQPLQVVLVGRPNVGKSTLFNRLLSGTRPCTNNRRRVRSSSVAGAVSGAAALQANSHLRREQLLQQAIVSPQAGTTRDRRIARAVFGGLQLLLVDTGGLEDKEITEASQLLTKMRKQVRVALRDADCVLFVVDAKEGITPVDVLLARLVREWLAEEEQQKQQQRHSDSPQSTAASVVTTVRAAEKRVGGRPAMQQHQSGGRRLVLLPWQPDSATAQAKTLAAAGTILRDEARELTACGPAATYAAASAVSRVADAAATAACSKSATTAACATRAAHTTAADVLEAAAAPVLEEDPEDCTVPVILVANKADGCFLGSYLSDCYELALGSPVIVSAKKNEGFDDLYDRLVLETGHRQRALEAVWQPTANAEDGSNETEDEISATRRGSGEGADAGGYSAELVGHRKRGTTKNDGKEEEEEEEKYIRERVTRAPQPSGEADSWLEGLVRRYGKCGMNESYKQLCDPASSMHLPWDLSRTSLAAAVTSEDSAASVDAADAAADGHNPARGSAAAAGDAKQTEKKDTPLTRATYAKSFAATGARCAQVAAARAEWRRASAGVVLPVEEELVSLRNRRSKLRTKEGRDRLFSLKRQLLFDETIHLAVIGRPNVGKSTLVNALLQQERMIVSDEPGTTTDSTATDWEYKRHPFCLIDTSGVTRGWKVKHTDLLLEAGMQTLRNIRRAQVCILCVDGSAAESSGVPVSAHELSLAHLATSKEGRCLVVCITKWDLVPEQQRERVRKEVLERLQTGLGHVKGCPVVFTAAKHGHNLDTLMNRVLLLYRRWNARIPTSKLNAWLQQFLLHFPPPWRLGSRCQIKYLTQVKARPPTFVAWSNVYSAFPVNYQRQLQNAMREEFSLGGTPIRFIMRTTANLPTGKKLSKKELLKWRRKTHKPVRAALKLSRGIQYTRKRQIS